jgi:hypothetical protein
MNKWVMDDFHVPIPADTLAVAETGYAICLDRLVHGKADAGDIGQLGYLCNMTVLLCEKGFGPECLAEAKAGQEALMNAMARGLKGKAFGCTGDEVKALRATYQIHRAQCEACGRGHILAASKEVERRQAVGDVAFEVVEVRQAA